jgi:UDP-N-acetylmuramate-alanine ligase
MDDAERLLAPMLREGDVLLTLGAGDVDRVAARLTARAPAEPAGTAP